MKLLTISLTALLLASTAGGQVSTGEDRIDWSKFKSDGCTWWPDKDYADCCVEHDKAYFVGGTQKERRRVDDRLYKCVIAKDRSRNKRDAQLMWLGVRVGGLGWLPTPFRWGYGTDYWKTTGAPIKSAEKGRR